MPQQLNNAIPTNIITGFLGTGKTSAILHLLKSKPANENWAILVNEFGEIGVDGSLFWGNHSEQDKVFIREVPGGCMCCASGFSVQIALSQLLSRARFDRLLIEPTGLGHPIEVLELLSSEYYQKLLRIQKVITLVDARKLNDKRYTEHETFNQQIATADVLVGNKQDLYCEHDRQSLIEYSKKLCSPETNVIFTEHGELDIKLLQGETRAIAHHHHHHHQQDNENKKPLHEETIPECGYIRANNEGEGFQSVGWRFSPQKVFNHKKLVLFLTGIVAERMKAVFITEDGVLAYNLTPDALTEQTLDDCLESRIEIIAERIDTQWEKQLLACLETN